MAGLIIFPACSAYNIEPTAGPPLIFITLPNVFNHMAGGRLWGTMFLPVYVLRGVLHGDRGVPEHHFFATDLTGCSIKKAADQHCGDHPPFHPLCAGL